MNSLPDRAQLGVFWIRLQQLDDSCAASRHRLLTDFGRTSAPRLPQYFHLKTTAEEANGGKCKVAAVTKLGISNVAS